MRKKLSLCGLFIVLAFEIFLTQSRTALAVNLCVFVIFALICLYRVQKKLFILLVILGIGYSSAFAGSMEFLKYGQVPSQIGEWTPLATKWQNMQKKEKELNQSEQKKGKESNRRNPQTSAMEYVEHNLKSLSGSGEKGIHAGSNHSRFTVQKTHIQIGLEHPVLGVGTSLRQGYLREKLDKDPGGEIQKWNKNIDKWGLLGAGFPNLGDFTLRFAETGFLGLGLYLFPALILLWQYGKILIRREMEVERIGPFIFSALSFVGIMATGLGDGINITFCYWTAMAISFLLLFSKGDNNI